MDETILLLFRFREPGLHRIEGRRKIPSSPGGETHDGEVEELLKALANLARNGDALVRDLLRFGKIGLPISLLAQMKKILY